MDSAAAHEHSVVIAEHPDAEPMLTPVRELPVEELLRFPRILGCRPWLGAERGEYALVSGEVVQVVKVGLRERESPKACCHQHGHHAPERTTGV
jgi:hypothetical protein